MKQAATTTPATMGANISINLTPSSSFEARTGGIIATPRGSAVDAGAADPRGSAVDAADPDASGVSAGAAVVGSSASAVESSACTVFEASPNTGFEILLTSFRGMLCLLTVGETGAILLINGAR